MTFEDKLEDFNLRIRMLNNLYSGSGMEWVVCTVNHY